MTLPEYAKPGLLLTLDTPLALISTAPRNFMPKKVWNEKYKEVTRQKYDFHCECCGEYHPKWEKESWSGLETHEEYNIDFNTGKVTVSGFHPWCKLCHNFKHLRRNFKLGRIYSLQRINEITNHGLSVLNRAGLQYQAPYIPDHNIKWNEWYLEWEDKQYYSPYENEQDFIKSEILTKIEKGWW